MRDIAPVVVAKEFLVKRFLEPRIQKLIDSGWNDADYIARQVTDDLVRVGALDKYKGDDHLFSVSQVSLQTFIESFAEETIKKNKGSST